jgi:hypothetical protein
MPCVMQECTQHEARGDVPAGSTETAAEELTGQEREQLERLRRAIARGERSESYPVDKRQDFVRWLIEQGKLSEN